jgi:RNA polymerase sigma factor (sigma-70 family)
MAQALSFLTDDARLLDALREGKEEAMTELFFQNRRAVTSLVVGNNGSDDDAEDILQEALVILWENIRNGKFTYQAKLSTYIYGTAKNLWLRRLARSKKEVPLPEEEPASSSAPASALDDLIASEETQAIADAMARMGSPCKELLLLYYWEERSMEEIAATLHFSGPDTAKSKKYQCKKLLESYVRKSLGVCER